MSGFIRSAAFFSLAAPVGAVEQKNVCVTLRGFSDTNGSSYDIMSLRPVVSLLISQVITKGLYYMLLDIIGTRVICLFIKQSYYLSYLRVFDSG